MLFVFSKEKIISYIIAFSTVLILLVIGMMDQNQTKTVQTSTNIRQVPIYSVDTEENKVSLTINCAW